MIDIVENLNTKPETSNRTAQSATEGAAKMMNEKAGGQGTVGPSGKVNVMANLGVQQQEQRADANINKAVQANQQQLQQQANLQTEEELMGRKWNEQELALQQAYDQQFNDLIDTFTENQANIANKKQSITNEALAQSIRLQDKAYMDRLQIAMNKELLETGLNEQQMTARLAFGEELQALKDQADWKIEFEKERIDQEFLQSKDALHAAFRNGKAMILSDQKAATWNAASSIVNTGTTAYGMGIDADKARDAANRQKFEDEQSGYNEWLARQEGQ